MDKDPANTQRAVRRGDDGTLEVFPASRRLGRAALACFAFTVVCLWMLFLAKPTTLISPSDRT